MGKYEKVKTQYLEDDFFLLSTVQYAVCNVQSATGRVQCEECNVKSTMHRLQFAEFNVQIEMKLLGNFQLKFIR